MRQIQHIHIRCWQAVPACAALSLLLAGCGGGGGGESQASMTLQSSTPNQGATGVATDKGTATVSVRIHGFSEPRGALALRCGAVQYAGTDTPAWSAAQELLELRLSYDGLPGSASCRLEAQAEATNATGPNVVSWSVPFTTGPATPLHYGPLLVGILGDRVFVLDFKAGTALQRQPAPTTGPTLRPPPTPFLLGTALTPTGRIPLAAMGHGAGGPFAVLYRFNPLSLQQSVPSDADPMPVNHEFSGSFSYGSAWQVDKGGVGPAPTPSARFWSADGAGGWFYVEDGSPDTLRRRTAAGSSTVVHQQTGENFGSLRVFSN
ncbi:hypothetical protein QRD43_05960 [Pelomonas sp. APW6]|uniref:Uncharacterized protein n=1 Tax=Roseateles subflavus TaxID=3053353 RepID=A0ABT7LF32_9BURK|nr:hypothetical protein [Pelomonas sp. APW6]MDL5031447.1 hypothetical protein [Pelomonas sp. APW6]